MNGYLMEYGGKRYATNADNVMEAEDKLFIHLGDVFQTMRLKISQVESLESIDGKDEITFF